MQASVGQCRPIAAQPCQQRVLLVGGGCNSNLDLVVAGWGFVWVSNLVFYSRRGFPSFENNFQVILHSVLKPCVKHSCWVLLKAFAKSFFREWLTSFRIHCWHRVWKHSWNHFGNYVLNHVKTVSKSVRKHAEILSGGSESATYFLLMSRSISASRLSKAKCCWKPLSLCSLM